MVTNTTSVKWLIIAAAIVASGVPLAMAASQYTGIDYYGYGLRVTARVAVTFFVFAYVARPLVQVLGVGQWLVRHRRYLGLAAALTHTVHFGFVVAHDSVTDQPADLVTWVLGGLAFVLFWVMAATSNNVSVRQLGVWWRRLHRFGMHYIWLVFFYTYLGAAVGTGGWYWTFPVALLSGLVLRIAAFARQRAMRTAY